MMLKYRAEFGLGKTELIDVTYDFTIVVKATYIRANLQATKNTPMWWAEKNTKLLVWAYSLSSNIDRSLILVVGYDVCTLV